MEKDGAPPSFTGPTCSSRVCRGYMCLCIDVCGRNLALAGRVDRFSQGQGSWVCFCASTAACVTNLRTIPVIKSALPQTCVHCSVFGRCPMRALPSVEATFRNTLLQTHGRGTLIPYTLQAQAVYPALFYIFRTAQQWSPVVGPPEHKRMHPPPPNTLPCTNRSIRALTSSSWPRASSAHAASKWGQIHGGKHQTPSSLSRRFLTHLYQP